MASRAQATGLVFIQREMKGLFVLFFWFAS